MRDYLLAGEIWDGPFCDEFIKALNNTILLFEPLEASIHNHILLLESLIRNYNNIDNTNINNISNIIDNWSPNISEISNRGDDNESSR